MRIVVVGGGVIGMLTAMECVRAGALVDLVDRADIPSPVAASYDRHRVVRTLHRGDAALTIAAARLDEDWLEIERLLGGRFYHRTGVLTAMAGRDVDATSALLAEADAAFLELSGRDLAQRYPHVRFGAGDEAVLEPSAGTVLADRALRTAAGWLGEQPAVRLHPHRRVVEVDDAGSVRLADGTVLAGDGVVVAAGPWSRELLPAGLAEGLTLKRQTMVTYRPTTHREAWSASPAVLGLGAGHDAWLMPPVAGTPVRLSAASACRSVPALADRDTPAEWREHLLDRFGGLLAGFDPTAVTGTTEGYYLTDETGEGPLLAELGDGGVWAYGACGGMSFKFAPVIARALADRAMGRPRQRTGLHSLDRPGQLAHRQLAHRAQARRLR
jgi:glycine/D-amino acid oxidase-like deaminating enzyme